MKTAKKANGDGDFPHVFLFFIFVVDSRLRRGLSDMPKYVDGFVLVVPEGKDEEYRKMAEMGRDSWMRHGALEYYECRGDDLMPPEMGGERARSFPDMAGAEEGETVWYSFIIFKSKAHRDEVNALVMKEMSEAAAKNAFAPMPLDMKHVAYGGFQVEVEG
jgi:uncharacterized protein YbaA (DUF1428 family)